MKCLGGRDASIVYVYLVRRIRRGGHSPLERRQIILPDSPVDGELLFEMIHSPEGPRGVFENVCVLIRLGTRVVKWVMTQTQKLIFSVSE